jgi:hypothetical protein
MAPQGSDHGHPGAARLPQTIYIVRHGEKPEQHHSPPFGVDADGTHSTDSLIPRGWERAGSLVALFAPLTGALRKGMRPPTALMSPDYGDALGHRTAETLLPLSRRLGKRLMTPKPVGRESEAMAAAMASGERTLLICWEHQHIPHLARALPLDKGTVIPSAWPDDRFDIVWCFELDLSGPKPAYRFQQLPQLLLDGDLPSVIATQA